MPPLGAVPGLTAGGTLWLIAGLALAALEMVVPGVFLLWIGLAALLTGAAAALTGIGLLAQLVLFIAATALLIGLAARRLRQRPQIDVVNAPTAGLIGRLCHAIAFQDGQGRVSLGDGTWPARVTDASQPVAGQALKVVGLDGTTLLVEAAG